MRAATDEAIKRFYASAPTDLSREVRTVDLWYGNESPANATARVSYVQDTVDYILGGVYPNYSASSMVITEPSEQFDGEQMLTCKASILDPAFKAFIDGRPLDGSRIYVRYIRFFEQSKTGGIDAGTDSTEDIVLNLSLSSMEYSGYASISFVAEDLDLSNKRAGARYTLAKFPGLASL